MRRANKKERKDRAQYVLATDWNPASDAARMASRLRSIDSRTADTAKQVAAKQEEYDRLRASASALKAKLIADAWCVAFVAPKTPTDPPITDRTLRALEERSADELAVDIRSIGLGDAPDNPATAIASIRRLADQYQFTHLHLAFPDCVPSSRRPVQRDQRVHRLVGRIRRRSE